MQCPYCHQEAIWCENKEIYGKNYGESYMIYLCRSCDASVGCHNNTRKSKGTMANKELREWRIKAHAEFDPLWRDEKLAGRKRCYRMMTHKLGLKKPLHMGEATIDICKDVIFLTRYLREDLLKRKVDKQKNSL